MYPLRRSGHVHEVVSPAGGSLRVAPADPLDGVDEVDGARSEALTEVGQRGRPVAQRSGHAGGQGMSGGAGIRSSLRGSSGVEAGTVLSSQGVRDRLVPDQQVVVHLHDHQAARRAAGHRFPWAGCPRRDPGPRRSATGCWRSGASAGVSGRGVSPKHVQPLPSTSSASAAAARSGGTRKKMAWWSSALRGRTGWRR